MTVATSSPPPAQVRAELVRPGQVAEHGVRLGRQDTHARVGHLVEARALDWTMQGHEGNSRPAITRERYRAQAVRDDGALEVAVVHGRTPDGDVLGERLVLPARYVAEHLALGYASTVYAAQGVTVDTSSANTSPTPPCSVAPSAKTGHRRVSTASVRSG